MEQDDEDGSVPPGMKLDAITADDEEEQGEEDTLLPQKKVPERKTRQQRQKAAKHLAEV